jgi:1-phosphofructokinase family hexose kinase
VEMVYGGGKGNNTARALVRLGVEAVASGFQGGYSGHFCAEAMQAEYIQTEFVFCRQATRTSLLIHEEETSTTYPIYEPGQLVEADEIQQLEETFQKLITPSSIALFCGSGQSAELANVFARLIAIAREKGARTILDSSGQSLIQGLRAKPFMLKVNNEELAECIGRALSNEEDILLAALEVHAQGIPFVAVSLGGDGFLITDGKQAWQGVLRMERVINVVGCGDSLLAGVCKCMIDGAGLDEMVRWGVACGAANTQVHGAGFIEASLVTQLLPRVTVKRLKI